MGAVRGYNRRRQKKATIGKASAALPMGSAPEFVTGTRVLIDGLKARPALNGVCGVVKDYDAARGRYAVQVLEGGEAVLLKPANLEAAADDDDDTLALEENGDDESDGLALEDNADEEDDGLQLEENAGDDDDDDELALEENPAEDDDDDDDELALEENGDDDDDGLALEENDGGDEEDELVLEDGPEEEEEDGLVLEEEVEEISTEQQQRGFGGGFGGGYVGGGGGGSYATSSSIPAGGSGVGTDNGLAEALRALGGASDSAVAGASGAELGGGQFAPSGYDATGQLIEPERFLIPSAKAKLEEAQMLYPQKEGESLGEWTCRLTTILAANDPPEVRAQHPRRHLPCRRRGWPGALRAQAL